MSFQDQLSKMTTIREQALEQQKQQSISIVEQWKPTVYELLRVVGENTWGKNRYAIVEPDKSSLWTLVHFKGSKNSQIFVILDFDPVDVDEILASGQTLPQQLTRASRFRIVSAIELVAEPFQQELEQKLIIAVQNGFNQDPLPSEIKRALRTFPYQIDEYDQRAIWEEILLTVAGPTTALIGIAAFVVPMYIMLTDCTGYGASWRPECESIISFFARWLLIVCLLAPLSVPFLIASIWSMRKTDFGRRITKLRERDKLLATIAVLPGIVAIICAASFVIIALLALLAWAGAAANKSEVRQAVHNELKERGL